MSNSTREAGLEAIAVLQVDIQSCALLGGVSLVVQGLLGVALLTALLVKRALEHPKRSFTTWALDVSKQASGQLLVHFTNLFSSNSIAQGAENCSLYLLNIVLDSTLGVAFVYGFGRLQGAYLAPKDSEFQAGVYQTPRWRPWCKQTAVFLAALAVMKAAVLCLLLIDGLVDAADAVLSLVPNKDMQTVLVVAIIPLLTNAIQALVTDQIIMGRSVSEAEASYERLNSS